MMNDNGLLSTLLIFYYKNIMIYSIVKVVLILGIVTNA